MDGMAFTESERPQTLDSLFARVRHLHHHRAVAVFERLGLLFGQPPVLFALWHQDGQTQSELARHMNRTPATVTSTLGRMERDGWVVRRTDETDHRIQRVFLTQKALDIRIEAEKEMQRLDALTFSGFDEVERALLRRFLLQIEHNLLQYQVP
jgi:DNA-binding MarR family transcriptional regulator